MPRLALLWVGHCVPGHRTTRTPLAPTDAVVPRNFLELARKARLALNGDDVWEHSRSSCRPRGSTRARNPRLPGVGALRGPRPLGRGAAARRLIEHRHLARGPRRPAEGRTERYASARQARHGLAPVHAGPFPHPSHAALARFDADGSLPCASREPRQRSAPRWSSDASGAIEGCRLANRGLRGGGGAPQSIRDRPRIRGLRRRLGNGRLDAGGRPTQLSGGQRVRSALVGVLERRAAVSLRSLLRAPSRLPPAFAIRRAVRGGPLSR